jgi:hypothetical protein
VCPRCIATLDVHAGGGGEGELKQVLAASQDWLGWYNDRKLQAFRSETFSLHFSRGPASAPRLPAFRLRPGLPLTRDSALRRRSSNRTTLVHLAPPHQPPVRASADDPIGALSYWDSFGVRRILADTPGTTPPHSAKVGTSKAAAKKNLPRVRLRIPNPQTFLSLVGIIRPARPARNADDDGF